MTLTASEVMSSISNRWPDNKWIKIREAPCSDGRRADLLCLDRQSTDIDVVEIKVSLHDLIHELTEPEKSACWVKNASRFWLALPVDLFDRASEFVPPEWGVLAVPDIGTPELAVEPAYHPPAQLSHESYLRLIGAAVNGARRDAQRDTLENLKAAYSDAPTDDGKPLPFEDVGRVYYTIGEVAHMLHCSKRTVYRAIDDGRIPVVDDLLGKRRIPARQFDQLLEGSTLT